MTELPTTAGLHHVSVLAGDAARNARFRTRTRGQSRMIGRTVDYGAGEGRVGSTLAFFPFPMAARGVIGSGETPAVTYAVRADSLPGRSGRGTVHHLAFRAPDDAGQAAAREALLAMGLQVSEVRERRCFRSIYSREPGGIRCETATDGPGVTADETTGEVGS